MGQRKKIAEGRISGFNRPNIAQYLSWETPEP